jgi:hypothetical protein
MTEGSPRPAARIYLGIALALSLLALVLFLAVSAASARIPNSQAATNPVFPTLPSFIQLLGSFLALSALAAALAAQEATSPGKSRSNSLAAWCFGATALAWGFVGILLFHGFLAAKAPVWSIPVLVSGLLLIVTIAAIGLLSLADARQASPQQGVAPRLSALLFALTGFTCVVWSTWKLWVGLAKGLRETSLAVSAGASDSSATLPSMVLWLFPHAVVVAVGSIGVALAAATRRSPHEWPWASLASALAYAGGSTLVVTGLARRTALLHAYSFDYSFLAGVGLVGAAILLRYRGTTDPLQLGGTALLVLSGFQMYYSDLIPPQAVSIEVQGWGGPVMFALGSLAIALSPGLHELTHAGRLREVVPWTFLSGATLLAFGLHQGLGVRALWRLDVSTLVGVTLASAALAVSLLLLAVEWARVRRMP